MYLLLIGFFIILKMTGSGFQSTMGGLPFLIPRNALNDGRRWEYLEADVPRQTSYSSKIPF